MKQRTLRALYELSGALWEEAEDGDVVLTLPVKTYNAIVPMPPDTSGLMEYVLWAAGGRVTFRMDGEKP